jgi:hypothetical protein
LQGSKRLQVLTLLTDTLNMFILLWLSLLCAIGCPGVAGKTVE